MFRKSNKTRESKPATTFVSKRIVNAYEASYNSVYASRDGDADADRPGVSGRSLVRMTVVAWLGILSCRNVHPKQWGGIRG